ncbi:NAD(P)-binding domain-containing protein [Pseudosulfitobacter sp. DSM 107133]|uniref:NAD(P)-binding domain-containing protein n=1 Tax=Pseudosulfitobacter sp. DSM 107133 TaxID=2883100 RepID=UPI000DF3D293|nr:NAD(P)-binding domain-containing protein [Pseudosulfitobacter sp. DSM 107133]UOA27871.1 putative oxidoreductase CzcO [Pseudosulfitobacter sp. DSM 107133]
MRHIRNIIIGAGQAGLAMSHCLTALSQPHVVLERGVVGNSWARERWDSLRLLTPNWQSRLPGHVYSGSDPDGFMTARSVVEYLAQYANASAAPVQTGVTVTSVSRDANGYIVATNKGIWRAANVVLASGACNRASVPSFADDLPQHIVQVSPLSYHNPTDLPKGGVLVVGASATGVQLAAEIHASGRPVILAAGNHIRMPRHYRGHDIQWWMEHAGLLSATADTVDDIARARSVPSLQLVGDPARQFLDLNALQNMGIEIVGRLAGMHDTSLMFSGALANAASLSDLKMNRALTQMDNWVATTGLDLKAPPVRFAPTWLPTLPRLTLDISCGAIKTVVWATGFAPDYSWLHLPVFDAKGRLVHNGGIVAPGLYALGLPFMRTRKSSLIDGVGDDARWLARHIATSVDRRAA